MHIQLISLQIAGGIILFLFGLQMIFGQAATAFCQSEAGHDIAVFPLAIPSIVGPEAIMVVILLTDNYLYSVATQAITAGVIKWTPLSRQKTP
jgi:multiple antibiotic resistance protein